MRICMICLVPFCVYCSDLYICVLPSFATLWLKIKTGASCSEGVEKRLS